MINESFRIKPEPTERIKRIFQEACRAENIVSKFGKTLTPDENIVRRFILIQTSILGRIPYIAEIIKEFPQLQKGKINTILNKLDKLDVIHLDEDKTNIVAAYPFSGSETPHKVSLKRKPLTKVSAMCAVDALGISFMFDCDVSIESLCSHCEESIEIEVRDNEIILLKPRSAVVWFDMESSGCAATSVYKNTNFFSSNRHFEEWKKSKPRRRGKLLLMEEAFYLGKLYFENRLKY